MKYSTLLLLGTLTSPLAHTASLDANPSSEFGRLFNTPAQRQALDQQRRGGKLPPREAQPEELRLDGIVTSSDGRQTVWINGSPADKPARVVSITTNSARLNAGRGQSVEVPVGGSLRLTSDADTK